MHRRHLARSARTSIVVGSAAVGLLAGSLLVAAPAQAKAVDQQWEVTGNATITIDGRGFGHGRGMSQYGAEGAARAGLDHRAITDFYYPGTTRGSLARRVAVLLSAANRPRLVVLARPGLRVRDLGAKRTWQLPSNGAKRWRLVPLAGGGTRVDYRAGGWKRWKRLRGEAQFAAGGRPITLRTSSGLRPYRGALRSAAATTGARPRQTINVLSLENYLKGVVPREIPASWSPAAVQAQAVAARTYAAHQLQQPRARHYHLCDTTACQVYGGFGAEHPATNRAITATRREILLSGGAPAFTQYSSSNGGRSAAGSASHLVAQSDPYDGWDGNPNHTWRVNLTDTQIERAWPRVGDLQRIRVTQRDGGGQWQGRITRLALEGSGGTVTLSGDDFRFGLGLRSTWLTFTVG